MARSIWGRARGVPGWAIDLMPLLARRLKYWRAAQGWGCRAGNWRPRKQPGADSFLGGLPGQVVIKGPRACGNSPFRYAHQRIKDDLTQLPALLPARLGALLRTMAGCRPPIPATDRSLGAICAGLRKQSGQRRGNGPSKFRPMVPFSRAIAPWKCCDAGSLTGSCGPTGSVPRNETKVNAPVPDQSDGALLSCG